MNKQYIMYLIVLYYVLERNVINQFSNKPQSNIYLLQNQMVFFKKKSDWEPVGMINSPR